MSVGSTVSLMQTEAVGFAQIHTIAAKLTLNGTCSTDCCQFILNLISEAVDIYFLLHLYKNKPFTNLL